jgi:hypothetical protein
MTRKLLLFSLLIGLFVLGTPNVGFAREKTNGDVLGQLLQEGWTIVNEGVLRRELRPNEVEHFVFGSKGFTWKLQDLRAQYVVLQAKYRATPTSELKQAIANHRKAIASTMQMIRRAKAAEEQGLADDLKVSCTINFGYDGNASYKTNVQGVWAEGKANFGANCAGFTGEVYAYAYAQVTVNGGPLTKTVTDGPRSGANVSAYAYSDLNGGPSCESYAYGSMTSNNLNPSSYSKAAQNLSCPVVATPPAPLISGATSVDLRTVFCKSVTWTSTVSGGTTPFTYSWKVDGYQEGTGASFTKNVCRGWGGGFTLSLTVTDVLGLSGSNSRFVTVLESTCTDACLCASPTEKDTTQINPCL